MVAVADRVIVELEAKLDKYNANVRAAEARFTAATRSISRDAKSVEAQMSRSTGAIGNQLRGLAGTFAAAFSVQQIGRLADGYTRFTNQLKVAGLEGNKLAGVQTDLFGVAQRYGVELESLGSLYSKSAQAGKELGASQAELLQFTTGVAAALKIQGGSAASAQGALLQLSQALGSGTVRAEEFNSVQEGARPILQAVATNLEAAGGSVAKLKVLVNDGKVSSEQFFRAFLAGSKELEAQAEKAGLTIAASFQILNNALGKYIGEADQSLSATQRISAALIELSKNLDTVVAALGVLGAILLGRVVAGMVASASATSVLGTALFAVQARAVGAATSMEALALVGRTAGARLLGAFGGPVGLAVTGLALGIGYLVTASNDAEQAAADLKSSIDAQSEALGTNEQAQLAAAAAANTLSANQRAILTGVANLTGEVNLLSTAWGRVAASAKAAAIEQAKAALVTAQLNYKEAKSKSLAGQIAAGGAAGYAAAQGRYKYGVRQPDRTPQQAAQELQAARNVDAARAYVAKIEQEKLITFKPPVAAAPAGKPTKTKTAKDRKGPDGPDLDAIARQFQTDMENGQLEYDRAMAEAVGTVAARVAVMKQAIALERVQQERSIMADKDLSAAQKADLVAAGQRVAVAQLAAIDAEEARQLEKDKYDLLLQENELATDTLESQSQFARTREERLDFELRLLDLAKEAERIQLEQIAADVTLRDATRERARIALAQLDEKYGRKGDVAVAGSKSPGQAYAESFNAESLNDQLEKVAVDGLKGIEDQLTATIGKVFELGGAFGSVANQIIQALIRIAIQKAIIGPLSNALFGGGEGLGGLVGSIFGKRASGGHVVGGNRYQVNEGGGIEGFQPAGSGKIIPLGRMNPANNGGGTTIIQTFTLDARHGITTPELLRHVDQVASSRAAQAGQAAFQASQKQLPERFAKLQKLGR